MTARGSGALCEAIMTALCQSTRPCSSDFYCFTTLPFGLLLWAFFVDVSRETYSHQRLLLSCQGNTTDTFVNLQVHNVITYAICINQDRLSNTVKMLVITSSGEILRLLFLPLLCVRTLRLSCLQLSR